MKDLFKSSSMTPADSAPTPPAERGTSFDIAEEFGTASKNLPPIAIVLTGVVLIGAIVGALGWTQRARSTAAGSIDDVVAVDVPDQNMVMVAIDLSVTNNGKRTYWIRSVQATLETADNHFSDDAASGIDFRRYFHAFPALQAHALPPLGPEARIDPTVTVKGTVIVTFPVTMAAFIQRKGLTVTIHPYDQPVPLVLKR